MSTNQTLQIPDAAQLAEEITALVTPAKIVTVAIAGPPGSGKSTLAADLARRIGPSCCLIPMDGFHLDNATLSARGLLSVKGAPETFDLTGFENLIEALQTGRATQFPTFDRDLDGVIEKGGSVPDELSILLFEGNYLLFDEPGWAGLAETWDAAIWLDVPHEILETRLIKRWLAQGMPEAEARERAQANDLVNARRVNDRALPATWIMRYESSDMESSDMESGDMRSGDEGSSVSA